MCCPERKTHGAFEETAVKPAGRQEHCHGNSHGGVRYLTCTGGVTAEQFLTVFTVVIAFYFGTQAEKRNSGSDGNA